MKLRGQLSQGLVLDIKDEAIYVSYIFNLMIPAHDQIPNTLQLHNVIYHFGERNALLKVE